MIYKFLFLSYDNINILFRLNRISQQQDYIDFYFTPSLQNIPMCVKSMDGIFKGQNISTLYNIQILSRETPKKDYNSESSS